MESDTPSRIINFLKKGLDPYHRSVYLIFGAALHYFVLGLHLLLLTPVICPYLDGADLARQVEAVEDELELSTGHEPLVLAWTSTRLQANFPFTGRSWHAKAVTAVRA